MSTLTNITTSAVLELPNMVWVDEFAWTPAVHNTARTITGALLVRSGLRQAGRPITLQGGWLTRAQLTTLQGWIDTPGLSMTLLHAGQTFTVVADHESGALEAPPVVDYHTPAAGDFYAPRLRLLTI